MDIIITCFKVILVEKTVIYVFWNIEILVG